LATVSEQLNVQLGSVFAGDFRIDRALSQGGMGAVYVAEQLSTGKARALKVMLAGLVSDPSLRKRFEQEARIGSMIESEHVVEVVGAGIDAGTGLPWLAMELLQGEDLDHVVGARGALPVPEVAQLFQQLCHAVGAAHRVGVVHRDLKPENVFLAKAHRADATFMVKVLDFGIAKIVAEASTKQTAAMGSPIWMAPEQADQSAPITPATDVWALGLIAFFLLTGRPFWRSANDESATIPQVLKEVLFEPIMPASARMAELGTSLQGFDEWFSRCVARDPSARFPDASHAGHALLATLGVGMPPPSMLASSAYAATMQPTGAQMGSGPVQMGSGPVPTGSGPVPAYGPGAAPMPIPPAAMQAAGTLAQGVPGAAGQTGLPGAYTIPGQMPEATPPQKKSVSPGVAIGIIGVVAVLGVGGALLLANSHKPSGTTVGTTAPSTPSSSSELTTVSDAKKLADEGKVNLAHQRLMEIPLTSEARSSPTFKDVEQRWATETLQQADRTSDALTKRNLLESVSQSTTVDDSVRTSAKDKLAALDGANADGGASVPQPSSHGHKSVSSYSISPPSSGASPALPPSPPSPNGLQVGPAAPPGRTVSELAASTAPADWAAVRKQVESKVRDGTATVQEGRALQAVCKKEHDGACSSMCKSFLRGK
jgi:tRNA A-37 threonylcarbamoyl transferase component Bud32